MKKIISATLLSLFLVNTSCTVKLKENTKVTVAPKQDKTSWSESYIKSYKSQLYHRTVATLCIPVVATIFTLNSDCLHFYKKLYNEPLTVTSNIMHSSLVETCMLGAIGAVGNIVYNHT